MCDMDANLGSWIGWKGRTGHHQNMKGCQRHWPPSPLPYKAYPLHRNSMQPMRVLNELRPPSPLCTSGLASGLYTPWITIREVITEWKCSPLVIVTVVVPLLHSSTEPYINPFKMRGNGLCCKSMACQSYSVTALIGLHVKRKSLQKWGGGV